MSSRRLPRHFARLVPFASLLTLVACGSLLGIDDIHEGPAPGDTGGSSTAGSSTAGSSTGGNASGAQSGSNPGAGTSQIGGSTGNGGSSAASGSTGVIGEAGAAGAASTPGTPVHGHVIDYWGHMLSGVPVEIGGTLVTTDASGAFAINDVAAEYDASLVVQFPDNYDGQTYGWVFEGLTRRDPTLQVYSGLQQQEGSLLISVTNSAATLTSARTLSVAIGGPDGSDEFTEIDANGYQPFTDWRGPVMTQDTVHALVWQQDPTSGLPTGYEAWDTETVALSSAASAPSPVTVSMAADMIATGNIVGTVTPGGVATRANSVFLQFTSNAVLTLVSDSGPNTFSYLVPTITNSSVTFAASEGDSSFGAYAIAHKGGLAAGSPSAAVKIPIPASHLSLIPASAINKVDASTQFSFQADPGNTGPFLVYFSDADTSALKTDGLFIVTAKTQFTLPKVANDSFALQPGLGYYWNVETHGAFANVDAMAGPTGFLDSFSGDAYHSAPRGPRRGDGSYSLSASSDMITMAP